METIYCCDPLGIHMDRPLMATKKSKKKFRIITEDLVQKVSLQLQAGKCLCAKCRPEILRKYSNDQSSIVCEQEDRGDYRKFIVCQNPFNLHDVKRQGPGQKFYKFTDELASQCQLKNIELKKGNPLCFQCRIKALEQTQQNHMGEKHGSMRTHSVIYSIKKVSEEDILRARSLNLPLQDEDYLCISCRIYLKLKGTMEQHPNEGEAGDDNGAFAGGQDEAAYQDEEMDLDSIEPNYFDPTDGVYENHRYDAFKKLTDITKVLKINVPHQSQLREGNNSKELFSTLMTELSAVIIQATGRRVTLGGENCSKCMEHVKSLVTRFELMESKSEKYYLLTSVPIWVSVSGLITNFKIPKTMAQKVSKLRAEKGAISSPPPRLGRPMESKTIEEVRKFYLLPENSRVCPNQRDVVIIARHRVGNEIVKTRAARQELMMPLKQLHQEFKMMNPDLKISLSKFAQLRPKQCVWAYRRGFQQTCVCAVHCNFEYLLAAIKLPDNTSSQLMKFFCSSEHDCMMGICANCPNWTELESIVDDSPNDMIEAWQWVYTGEGQKTTELVKMDWSKEDFILKFQKEALKVAEHHFLYTAQKQFIKHLKTFVDNDSTKGVLLVDFGQNYSFVQPVEVQSLHWSHKQATVHPFMLYYYCEEAKEAKFKVYTVISDWLSHNANSFHAFRSVVVNDYIKPQFPRISHITYISDRPTSQYCNINNFVNTSHHETDYGITADWVFSAASHGKCPVDGMSALAKRLTRLESLRRKDNYILNAADMCHFLSTHHGNEDKYYIYASESLCQAILDQNGVYERYELFKSVKGTRQFHYIKPLNSYTLCCKKFAASAVHYMHSINKMPTQYQPLVPSEPSAPSISTSSIYPSLPMEVNNDNSIEDIFAPSAPVIGEDNIKFRPGSYIAALINRKIVFGVLMEVDDAEHEYKFKVMQKCPKGKNYKFKDPEKIKIYPTDSNYVARSSEKSVVITSSMMPHCLINQFPLCLVPEYTRDSSESLGCALGLLEDRSIAELQKTCAFRCTSNQEIVVQEHSESSITLTNAQDIQVNCPDHQKEFHLEKLGAVHLEMTCGCNVLVDYKFTLRPPLFCKDSFSRTVTVVRITPNLWSRLQSASGYLTKSYTDHNNETLNEEWPKLIAVLNLSTPTFSPLHNESFYDHVSYTDVWLVAISVVVLFQTIALLYTCTVVRA